MKGAYSVINLKKQILASTEIDRDNEKLSKEQLYSIYESTPDESLMGQEHDLSKKPIAKLYNKQFVQCDNGEYAIVADIEVYDEEAFKEYKGFSASYTTKRYTMFPNKTPEIEILFNPKYFDFDEIKKIVEDSTEKFSIDSKILKQKGLDTVAVLIIKFVTASYATGFFGKMGADHYDKIKKKLKLIAKNRKIKNQGETKLHFVYRYKSVNAEYDVLIELTPDLFDVIESKNILLDSAYLYIDKVVGNSNIKKVNIRMINKYPYWEILNFQDNSGNYIKI